MIYLSRLLLDARSREVQHELVDCHRLHGRVLSAFPQEAGLESARERFGVLYRVETGRQDPQLLVQSRHEPDWSRLPAGYRKATPECKRVDGYYERLAEGTVLIFRLRANPTRRISEHNRNEHDLERWRGQRVELRTEEDQLEWLARKARDGGFELLEVRPRVPDVRTAPDASVMGSRFDDHLGKKERLKLGSVLFEGKLRVRDAERFRQALEAGIGSGKAYGFGLLSVAPAPGEA